MRWLAWSDGFGDVEPCWATVRLSHGRPILRRADLGGSGIRWRSADSVRHCRWCTVNVDAHGLFSNLRVVVVDEIHAFAGDDRGWHLLAVHVLGMRNRDPMAAEHVLRTPVRLVSR